MRRRTVAIVVVLALLLLVSGYAIYTLMYVKQSNVPTPTVIKHSDGDYWKGKYIFSFAQANSSTQEIIDHYLVVMDQDGKYLKIQNSSTRNFNYIYQLSSNEIYYYASPLRLMDPNATAVPEATIWNMQTDTTRTILDGVNIWGHHEFLIEDGYFVTLRMVTEHGLDTVVQLDPETGNETWVWSSESLFTERPCSLCPDFDWTHGNDVTASLDKQYYFVNFRNTDSFAKINRETKELVWVAGRNGNFTLLENGVEKESLWYHSHIIKEVEPNVFIMFDNDFHNRTKLDAYPTGEDPFAVNYGGQSRLIKFAINETTMTTEIIWTYTADIEHFSPVFGDIDVLPNGNILGVFGTPLHEWDQKHNKLDEPFGAALLEISPEGKLIREYRFPAGTSIYRVQELSDDPVDYVGSWLLELE
jgi:hypothetical protein